MAMHVVTHICLNVLKLFTNPSPAAISLQILTAVMEGPDECSVLADEANIQQVFLLFETLDEQEWHLGK
jgi:hypothetical protein